MAKRAHNLIKKISEFNLFEIVSAIAITLLILWPLMWSGYYGDDALNSLINSALTETEMNIAKQFIANFKIHANHRLSILQLYHWVFYAIRNLVIYKAFVMSLVITNILLFSHLIYKVTKIKRYGYLALLLPALFIQFRSYGDPILVFHGLVETNLLFLLTSLILLIRFFESKRKKWIWLSVASYLPCILSYEYNYALFLLHAVVIWFLTPKENLKHRVKLLLPYSLMAISMALCALVVRSIFVAQGVGVDEEFRSAYVPNLELIPYLRMFFRQSFAGLPLSYFAFDPHDLLRSPLVQSTKVLLFGSLLVGLCYAALVFHAITQKMGNSEPRKESMLPNARKMLFFLGCGLLMIPVGIVSMSPKYQSEVIWGVGYTPVYISYFGWITILLAGIDAFASNWKWKNTSIRTTFILVPVLLAGFIGGLNYRNNSIVVSSLNAFWHYPRTLAENALRNGLMREAPKNSYLLIDSNFPWDNTTFILENARVKLDQRQYEGGQGRHLRSFASNYLIPTNLKKRKYDRKDKKLNPLLEKGVRKTYFDTSLFEFDPTDPVFYLDYYSDAPDNGYAFFGKVNRLLASNDLVSGVTADKVQIYVRTPVSAGNYRKTVLSGRWLSRSNPRESEIFVLNEAQMRLHSQGSGWKLFELAPPSSHQVIDMKSLAVSNLSKLNLPSFFWEPKPKKSLRLLPQPQTVIHTGIQGNFVGTGVSMPKVTLGPVFTIEFVVETAKETIQVPVAHILGNHPGLNNFEGIVIQQNHINKETYTFTYGDGKKWIQGGTFDLPEGKKIYVAIVVNGKDVRIYQNGKVSSTHTDGIFKNSELPLSIGNFINRDRPFLGKIEEVRILNQALAPEEIQRNVKRLYPVED
jgi:hypothetical protein